MGMIPVPETLYAPKALDVARKELKWEVDYHREAECQEKVRELFKNDPVFKVPRIHHNLSTKTVMTSDLLRGVKPLDQCTTMDQETRNFLARQFIRLGLPQLFTHRTMQTDPNWSNYLFQPATGSLWLIDFGATHFYPKDF